MGQKSNPNSFQKTPKNTNFLSANSNALEYSSFLKDQLSVSSNLTAFFEKKNCVVKECFFILSTEKPFVTLFISFFVFKTRAKILKKESPQNLNISLIIQKFFKVLSLFGYLSSKRLILQNLNKVASNYQKTTFLKEHTRLSKELSIFNKEIYFEPALFLFCLMNITKRSSSLISKFVSRFFRAFHRSKKINKFLLFLSKFVENTDHIKFKDSRIRGLKIQIKGRFNSVSRTQTRLFEKGSIPLQTISTKINYSLTHINTSYGVFSVKVWVFE